MSINSALSFGRIELENRKDELVTAIQLAFADLGLTSYQLGPLCGVSSSTIERITKLDGNGVTLDKLFLIAYSLGLSVNMKVVNVNQ